MCIVCFRAQAKDQKEMNNILKQNHLTFLALLDTIKECLHSSYVMAQRIGKETVIHKVNEFYMIQVCALLHLSAMFF